MPLDHSRANVTISVAGIALACVNKREGNRCEIGILRCDRHRPVLDIQRIEFDPRTRNPVRSSLIPHAISMNEDILVDVVYPKSGGSSHHARGTSAYQRRDFDRLDDRGDEEDFRWVADLEGPEFHGHKLDIKRASRLLPAIYVTEGVLYAMQKTDDVFARVSFKGRPRQAPLGKLAYGIAADICLPNGGEVVLSNLPNGGPSKSNSRCSVTLPKDDRFRYLITVENHCRLPDEFEGTDFRLFYQVLEDPDGKKQFDLRRMVETGCYAAAEEAPDGRQDFSLDGFPQNCTVAYLGETDSLKGNS